MIQQPALQRQTLRLYGEFLCRAPEWGGKLALACFAGCAGSGFAAAASLARAASLCVDSDAAELKLHFRDGAFDFLVNTVDEALRALKNEVRRGRPLAVALSGDVAAVARELQERGVRPDLLLEPPRVLVAGTKSLIFPWDANEPAAHSEQLEAWLSGRRWTVQEAPSASLADSSGFDPVRHRWLRNLTTHQRSVSSAARVMWLTPEERQGLSA